MHALKQSVSVSFQFEFLLNNQKYYRHNIEKSVRDKIPPCLTPLDSYK